MKNYLFILGFVSIMSLSGCGSITETTESVTYSGFDFSKYSKNGFLFTPEPYLGEYESVGILSAKFIPEVLLKFPSYSKEKKGNVILTQQGKVYYECKRASQIYYVKEIESKALIDSFYVKAAQMGADGVMNFKINYTLSPNGDAMIPSLEVSGFAIKRTTNNQITKQ